MYNYADDNFLSNPAPSVDEVLSNLKHDHVIFLRWVKQNGRKSHKFQFLVFSPCPENIELKINDNVTIASEPLVNDSCVNIDNWRLPTIPLQWRHNGHDDVSNHQPHDCLLSSLFERRSKNRSKLRVTVLCEGNSPVTSEFPAQRASNAEKVSIRWRHHDVVRQLHTLPKMSKKCLKCRKLIFQSYVLSNFTQCPIIRHICEHNNSKVEKVQELSLQIIYDDYETGNSTLLD